MRKPRAPKVRSKFHEMISRMPRDGMSTADAVRKLRREHKDSIDAELNDIIEIGLMRLAGDAFSRRASALVSARPDLFGEFPAPPLIRVPVQRKNGTGTVAKLLSNVTVAEAAAYAEKRLRPSPEAAKEIRELSRLVEFVRENGAKDTDNLLSAWEVAKKSG